MEDRELNECVHMGHDIFACTFSEELCSLNQTNPFLEEQITNSEKVNSCLKAMETVVPHGLEMVEVLTCTTTDTVYPTSHPHTVYLQLVLGRNFFNTCEVTYDLLCKLREICILGEPLLKDETIKYLMEFRDVLFKRTILVSVFGLHNTGKSTLLNTLLGESVLPVNLLSETSVTVRIQNSTDPTPVLSVHTGENMRHSITGIDEILKAVRDLNQDVRNGRVPPPLGVVLKIKTSVFSSGLPEEWEVSLVDNPGFGENNEHIDQVAHGAVCSSAVYVFLTTMSSIGGKLNAQFYKHLKHIDQSAYSDGRLLIAVTKFDENYQDEDDEESAESALSPIAVAELICTSVHKAAKVKIDPGIVIPISARWFSFSKNLKKCISEPQATPNQTKRFDDYKKKRRRVERALMDYSLLDIEVCGQGTDKGQALSELPPTQLAEYLETASGVPLLEERIRCTLSDVCVKTWKTKVFCGFDLCLNQANTSMDYLADRLTAIIRSESHEHQHLVKRYEAVVVKKEELEDCVRDSKRTKLWRELEEKFDQDLMRDNLQQASHNLVENLVNSFTDRCKARIADPQDHFGQTEFVMELDTFLIRGSVELNTFFDTSFVFTSVPSILLKRVGELGELYSDLCNLATSFLCCGQDEYSRDVSESSEDIDRTDSEAKDTLTSTQVSPKRLGELKSKIYIPPVEFSKWNKLKNFIRTLFTSNRKELDKELFAYKSFDEIKTTVSNMQTHLQGECQNYIHQIKPTAVEYYYSEYQQQATRKLSMFRGKFRSRLVQKEATIQQLEINLRFRREHLNLIVRMGAHIRALKEDLQRYYSQVADEP